MGRKDYKTIQAEIECIDPFLTLTQYEFAANVADQVIKSSRHEAIDRELRLVTGRMERAARVVDDTERLLGIDKRWQRDDVQYQKILQYIDNKKFVRVIEELQGLVVSRLMELDKVNLAGSGMRPISLRDTPDCFS
jgi:hypothetical protein